MMEYDDHSLESESSKGLSSVRGPAQTAEELARDKRKVREARAVKRVRAICFAVFVACAAAVCAAMYSFTRRGETSTFEMEFNGYVSDIFSLAAWEIKNNFALMAQLSASITTAAHLSESPFPYLTNSEFEVSGGYLDGLSGMLTVAFAPLVKAVNQTQWEEYSVDNQYWVEEGARLRVIHPDHRDPIDGTFQDHEERRKLEQELEEDEAQTPRIPSKIYSLDANGEQIPYNASELGEIMAPVWQIAPTPGDDPKMVNFNLLTDPVVADLFDVLVREKESVLSPALEVDYLFDASFRPDNKSLKKQPHSYVAEPVYASFETDAEMVGILLALTPWENLFNNILPKGASGIVCVVKSSCGDEFSFNLVGPKPVFLGNGDIHDDTYDKYGKFLDNIEDYPEGTEGVCLHRLTVYPSSELRASYNTNKPVIYTSAIALAFVLTAILFFLYDRLVTRRQKMASADAARTSAFVSTLFPANVRDRLFQDAEEEEKGRGKANTSLRPPPRNLRSFMMMGGESRYGGFNEQEVSNDDSDNTETMPYKSKAIADFFPEVSVIFADLAGFTAWSSAREPTQVFQLLETLYRAFDAIAKTRRVFKVETVGDCYVAATGLPEKRKDHAVAMARFARDCLFKTNELTRKLERVLGPDTGDLAMRIGLHSGPVTAGVLRGDNARFQLFGDTMNTAARVESSGRPGAIHVSQEFADQLIASGKLRWLTKREDTVVAKGKGELQTYWLHLSSGGSTNSDGGYSTADVDDRGNENGTEQAPDAGVELHEKIEIVSKSNYTHIEPSSLSVKNQRLIDWNASIVLQKLKQVVAQRNEPTTVITPEVVSQVSGFVSAVEEKYHDNDFHNFEHASHVTMSVMKLMSRVVASEEDSENRTFINGIASDAKMQLGIIFSALIHDVDHQGVPNTQLAKENPEFAAKYNHKSIAENNSIAVAWELFTRPEFSDFRTCIAPTEPELQQFRDTVVNVTLATDIVDEELKADRNARWAHAFSESAADGEKGDELKVRIVLEHLIQASDVCHTMQHWHIYRKWNERLFCEMYKAFRDGRAAKDPSEFWYQGELGFFDYYIIPLAKKLAECGVFGVSSDEYLNYAEKNRKEWELKGKEIIASMVSKCEEQYGG